jgi:hypothetical protein
MSTKEEYLDSLPTDRIKLLRDEWEEIWLQRPQIQQDIAELQGPSPTDVIEAGTQMARGDLVGGGMNMMRQLAPRLQGMDENVAELISRSVFDPSFAQQQQLLTSLTPVMDELRKRAMQQQVRAAGTSTTAGQLVPGLLD